MLGQTRSLGAAADRRSGRVDQKQQKLVRCRPGHDQEGSARAKTGMHRRETET